MSFTFLTLYMGDLLRDLPGSANKAHGQTNDVNFPRCTAWTNPTEALWRLHMERMCAPQRNSLACPSEAHTWHHGEHADISYKNSKKFQGEWRRYVLSRRASVVHASGPLVQCSSDCVRYCRCTVCKDKASASLRVPSCGEYLLALHQQIDGYSSDQHHRAIVLGAPQAPPWATHERTLPGLMTSVLALSALQGDALHWQSRC